MRQATCSFGERLTFTGFAPFGSLTMWWPLPASSPGRNRFVFVSVPRVSSFSKAELPNGLTSRFDGLHDLSEVQHPLLDHVVDNVDSALELRFHFLVGHVLHFHDLVEEERVPLVYERVRRRIPLVHRVRDQLVRLRLEPDEFDDLLDAPDDRIADSRVRLDDDEVEGGEQDTRRVDRRVL